MFKKLHLGNIFMRKILSVLLVLLCSFSALAKDSNKLSLPVRKQMNSISGHLRLLGPYIASENGFMSEANHKLIQKNIGELTQLFKNLKVHPVIQLEGLSINQHIMTEQLEQTVKLFNAKKKSEARAKFHAALNLCVSCHTQSPGIKDAKLFSDKEIESFKLTPYEKADMYFLTRDFEKAIKHYDSFLISSKKTDNDEFIFKSFERELIYYLKIKKSFSDAKMHLEEILKGKNFNDKVTQEVQDWLKSLSGKSLWDNFDSIKVTEDEMDKFMKTFIADDEDGPIFSPTNSSEVYDMNLSSILLDYYNSHPETKHGGRILYWLAMLDKKTNDDLYFSLGDYYLLACMEKYSKDPISKECYESYLEDMEINFTSKDKGL
jgi:tetratricopeptide (TPR) repeat protein